MNRRTMSVVAAAVTMFAIPTGTAASGSYRATTPARTVEATSSNNAEVTPDPRLRSVVAEAFAAIIRDEQSLVACDLCTSKETTLFDDAVRFGKAIYALPPYSGTNYEAGNDAYQALRNTALMGADIEELALAASATKLLLAKNQGLAGVIGTTADNPNYFVDKSVGGKIQNLAALAHSQAKTAATLLGLASYP